jgi:hypothetical protein
VVFATEARRHRDPLRKTKLCGSVALWQTPSAAQ